MRHRVSQRARPPEPDRSARASRARRMTTALDELLCTLLQEGCEVDPCASEAGMNASAAPFGVLYPAAFARANGRLHADLRLEVAVQASEASSLAVNVLFVEPSDHRIREFAVTPEEIGELVRR